MKKISNLLMMALLAIGMGLTSCDEQLDNALNPTVSSILLDADEMELNVGDEGQLKVTVDPADATVTWSSDKESVATVDATGKVTAVAEGIATITATAGDKTTVCTITVTNVLATPLTVEAITAGTIVVNNPQAGMQYSLNGGDKTAVTATAIDVAVGDKVAFYGNATSISTYFDGSTGTTFDGTAEVKAYGNIMSLVDETGFEDNKTLTADYTFAYLFYGYANLKDASGLLLPAETLTDGCYGQMFSGCSSLTTAPALPAKTLADYCYYGMFVGCSSLTTAPALPAESLTYRCYYSMFYDCISLTTAPKLPATTLAEQCYYEMFYGCTGLTNAYVKAAYVDTNMECTKMFDGCSATDAKLHTTNATSWTGHMGGANWTAVDDWTD